MRTRKLTFGLYADEQGLAWVGRLVEDAVRSRNARNTRIVSATVVNSLPGDEGSTAHAYDFLAQQWAVEHPGQSSGERQPGELRVRLVCSRRAHRVIRRTVISALCPEDTAPHACRVPWTAC
ncbi:hypothetical protein Snoj_14650 [Streptomyces nojiriensis]|uniref:Uncharacterized protein n=1 Tax=Streptomyces nojiriensis TaxID=66374 RepID=A0ABQ3SHW8_9ACTN|nr:hypothetical protein [Streptomyces nojiriensis]QTI49173.1 hypothetical protein JYK04_07044 [Streptomyces nojiriensis]GGS10835.1 hypothetical protein GCM10010205_45380 [Streptomyces nojiriensis]GHI67547.1 hypothetical protein Snoj_14650 [Streptomyces nojiriensis]